MFCATFYSFKGGVGRTLALANVAMLLAERGKKVLVVDFDLEAPGLPTLEPFTEAAGRPGIVDLVTEYVETGEVPALERYVHRCTTPVERNGDWIELAVDVMPAGRDDDDRYGDRLSRIDWNELYDDMNGFILMEEVRAGWQSAGYDYVLIDSRTGHTDVGGICTRQLPDAVVAVFFPNEQNLIGLRQVVRGVRQESARPDPIELLFVASRVPSLDDEHGHLRKRLERFEDELAYDRGRLVTIEHYDSMMLVNQAIFVLQRRTSGLADQYRNLEVRLSELNDADADGALAYANSVANGAFERRRGTEDAKERTPRARLDRIAILHAEDCIVQYACARAYYRLRDLASGADATDAALGVMGRTRTAAEVQPTLASSTHRLRLKILSELDDEQEAMTSARAILADEHSTETMVIDAMLAYASIDPKALATTRDLPAIANASQPALLAVARQLSQSTLAAAAGAELAEMALDRTRSPGNPPDTNLVQMILIAGGRFAGAVEAAGPQSAFGDNLEDAFNTAMAMWGRDGEPNVDAFAHVAGLFDRFPDPTNNANRTQCLALTAAVLGRIGEVTDAVDRARAAIQEANRREFSCWRYFTVGREAFEADLDAIAAFARGEGPPPAVVTGTARD